MPYNFVCKFADDKWTVAKTLGEDAEGITAEGATPFEFRKALKAVCALIARPVIIRLAIFYAQGTWPRKCKNICSC